LLHFLSSVMSIVVRTTIPPMTAVVPLRRALRGAAGDQALYQVRTMEQLVSASLDRQRFLASVFGVFAGLAVLLACIGIYGVLAYLTNQRVPEIGVRMALGASGGDVMRVVLRESLGMILIGAGVGLSAALAAGRILNRLVVGMRPSEPVTVSMMIVLLVAAALFASYLPARWASRLDPITALRQD
jgi:ABC-type antimicrobial peptide transport system permease subunit